MSKVNDLILFLDKNKEKKVGSVISEVREMCSKMGGSGDSVSLYDKNNKLVGLKCWYFEKWCCVVEGDDRFIIFIIQAHTITTATHLATHFPNFTNNTTYFLFFILI